MDESQSSKTERGRQREGGRERERERKDHNDSLVPTSSFSSPCGFIGEDVAITHKQNKQPNVNFSEAGTRQAAEKRKTGCSLPTQTDKRKANPVVGMSDGITPKLHPSKTTESPPTQRLVKDQDFSK